MADLNGVPPRRKDERDFEKEIRSEYLLPFLSLLAGKLSALSADAPVAAIIYAAQSAVREWEWQDRRESLEEVATRWANRLNDYHEDKFIRDFVRVARRSKKEITTVNVRPFMQGIDLRLKQRIDASVSLIETIPSRALDDLSKKLLEGELDAPLDLAAREKVVRKYFDETKKGAAYNIRRITRDQSNKLTGWLTIERLKALGYTHYKWKTSQDDRVRPTHSTKNNMIFAVNGDGPPDTGHPGYDIQCRCVAIGHSFSDDVSQRLGVV